MPTLDASGIGQLIKSLFRSLAFPATTPFKRGNVIVMAFGLPETLKHTLSETQVFTTTDNKLKFRKPEYASSEELDLGTFEEKLKEGHFPPPAQQLLSKFGYPMSDPVVDLVADLSASGFLTCLARTVNIPGDNVNEVEVPTAFRSFYVGGKYTTDTVSVTFMDLIASPVYRFFRSWERLVADSVALTMEVPSMYKGRLAVIETVDTPVVVERKTKESSRKTLFYTRCAHTIHFFDGVFPTSIAGWSLDVTSDDIITFDVTFRFDIHFLDDEIVDRCLEDIPVAKDSSGNVIVDNGTLLKLVLSGSVLSRTVSSK